MEPELELIGRHAMLFDDDANAAFVNSKEALVEWNSLFIDRYDVRHLLSDPPLSFRNLRHGSSSLASASSSPPPDSHFESQLDLERYADLPSSSDEPDVETEVEVKDPAGYSAVPFSYGNSADSSEQKNSDVAMDISSFRPPFSVPESLLQNLMGVQPPTEKLHHIIARTATFVGEHGGQSEIVLRVKQGDNPTFGFLMPDHHLHPYFRYLVDHPEVLKADNDVKTQDDKTYDNQTSGALSLLGSVYDSGEDEDGVAEVHRAPKSIDSGETSAVADMPKSHQSEQKVTSGNMVQKDEKISKLSQLSKAKAITSGKNRICNIKPGFPNGKKDGDSLGSTGSNMDKSKTSSLFPISKAETLLVDPPSEVKRLVDRIVEIILKNGKDFEAVLIEQDKKHGKFQFLLPSNQYHSYYLNILKKAQESRLCGKNFGSEKDGSSWQESDKKTASVKENDSSSLEYGAHELPLEYDRKEKFKMVISKSKKDSEDHPTKETRQQYGVSMDAASAAAILQAATRGTKKPNLEILHKTSLNGANHASSNEGAQASSHPTSQSQSLTRKQNENRNPSVTVPVAKEIAKTAALAAASEADSSEAGLTRQQKLKAERLRRAKMFAAMIKSGAAPMAKEPMRALSIEPPGSGVSGSATDIVNEEVKEREGSSVPVEARTSDKTDKAERNSSDDDNEQKSRKKRHYRSRKHDQEEDEDEDKREEDEEDRRHSRKKHRSHRSSRHHRDRSKDRHKHRRRHSSSKSKESRHRHRHETSSDDDDDMHHRHKHEGPSEDEDKHQKRRHNHGSSSEDERKHRKRKHKRSRKDEDRHERRSRKDERSPEEVELEEGEIRTKSSDQSPTVGDDACREAVVDNSKSSYPEKGDTSLPPSDTTEVPDELRAKIRAMLLATM